MLFQTSLYSKCEILEYVLSRLHCSIVILNLPKSIIGATNKGMLLFATLLYLRDFRNYFTPNVKFQMQCSKLCEEICSELEHLPKVQHLQALSLAKGVKKNFPFPPSLQFVDFLADFQFFPESVFISRFFTIFSTFCVELT